MIAYKSGYRKDIKSEELRCHVSLGSQDHQAEVDTSRKVLVATTRRWFITARLASALMNAGWSVEAVCPTHHPLGTLKDVRRLHSYNSLAGTKSFAHAIELSKPDLIISSDDLATQHLQELHNQNRATPAGAGLCTLIEHSLGSPESFPVVNARSAFMHLAQGQGIRVPHTEAIPSLEGLRDCLRRIGFPAVLKANGTSGGEGIRIVGNIQEAEAAYLKLAAPPLLARALKRTLLDQDATLLRPSLLRRRSIVNAQAFVGGREATSLAACWDGKLLAVLHFDVLEKVYRSGPASVVRLCENAEMSNAIEKIVRKLKLSGLHGFDFMVEEHSGNCYLIEMNPRATQVGHLSLGPGKDLPAALYAALTGRQVPVLPITTENPIIALFPQEWSRDPQSVFISTAYHDVPWHEPELISACLRKSRSTWPAWQKWAQENADTPRQKPAHMRSGSPLIQRSPQPTDGICRMSAGTCATTSEELIGGRGR